MTEEVRPARAGVLWDREEDTRLKVLFDAGGGLESIALALERSKAAVVSRLVYHNLLVDIGGAYHRVGSKWVDYSDITPRSGHLHRRKMKENSK